MKKTLLLTIITVMFVSFGYAQTGKLWVPTEKSKVTQVTKSALRTSFPEDFKLFQLDLQGLRNSLASVNGKTDKVVITIPNVNGTTERFQMVEFSNFTPELQAQFPEIRSYAGVGLDDTRASIRMSVAPSGVQTMVFRTDVENEFMEPYSADGGVYAVFKSSRTKGKLPFTCSTVDTELVNSAIDKVQQTARSSAGQLKTMRLALSCTAEYSNYFGATDVSGQALVLAGMNATMTRVNGVYEKDLAVHLNMVANGSVIFYDSATDPYDPSATGAASPGATWNAQLQTTLTANIGEANYDIGHLFGGDGGGGNAGCIGCVCVDGQKGSGFTSPADAIPAGDNFDIDYVAHEMGHQLGGNHTFTFSTENNSVNVEPGSGSTIMAYAGITNDSTSATPVTDVQPHSDDYFVYKSIEQIQVNLASKSCPVNVAGFTNTAPVMTSGGNWTIPKGTPFKLTGTGTDANGTLSYCWEQNDDANVSSVAATARAASLPAATKTNGPNFRSLKPVSVPFRYFPALSTVLSNSLSSTWEATSTVARTLNFAFTGRDNVANGGQTATAFATISVGTTGPFDVTSQATDGISYLQGSTQTVTWTVNGTTALVGSANVDILLSTDGGLTFGTTLASGVPNNGTASVTIPNVAATNCRIMVKPTGNVYYDINPKSFSIGYTCNSFTATPNLAIADGTGANVGGAIASSTFNYTTNVSISNLKLRFNTNHTWIGDLVLKLRHPDGTTVTFWSRGCNNPQNSGINATFYDGAPAAVCATPTTGNIQPATYTATTTTPTSFAVFNGKPSNGTWTLTAQDMYNGDNGNIVSWGIDFGCVLGSDTFGLDNFAIFPNPNNGNFTINFDSLSKNDINVTVVDMRGRQVYAKTYQNNGFFNQNIQLSNLQTGVYLVNVQDGDRKEVKKIIIE